MMLALFDSVDDTVLMKKAVLSEMMANLEQLCDDQFGRRVLLYLLAPRSSTHFSPQFVALLREGDGNAHSKKDPVLRQSELRGGVMSPLLDLAGKRACSWATSKCHAPLLLQIADSASSKLLPLPSTVHSMYCTLVMFLWHCCSLQVVVTLLTSTRP